MGDVTVLRGRGSADDGSTTAGASTGTAATAATLGEPLTIAALIAQAFGVLGNPPVTVRRPDAERPAGRARHLHVVPDA